LHGKGLVRRSPGNGAYVAEISVQDFKDLTEIRLFLMELLGSLAVARVTDAEIDEMEALIARLRETRDRSQALRIGSQFFRKIYQATGNDPLTRILQTLHDRVSRLWFVVPKEKSPSTELVEDYESIVAALRARDERKCIEALRENKLRFVRLVKQAILDDTAQRYDEAKHDGGANSGTGGVLGEGGGRE